MRRIGTVLVVSLVAAGLGGSTGQSVAVAKTPPHAAAVLAITAGNATPRLAWLEPTTLRPLARRSVLLPYGAWGGVFSPAGRSLALGGGGPDGVRIVDVRRMKITARIARRTSARSLTPVSWPEPRRLLVLDHPRQAAGLQAQLLVLDPAARRVVSRTTLRSSTEHWVAWARAGKRLVALVARNPGLARLVSYGPGGGVLRTTDLGISAGTSPVAGDPHEHHRFAQPGLAVDPEGGRAFVVDAGRIAVVDLDTFEVSYASLAESRSVVSRVLAWLEPAAHAKILSGFSRQATWLGNDLLAVSGRTYEETRPVPTGLQLVNTATGTTRTIEQRASAHTFSRGLLLAYGGRHDPETNVWAGMGVSAFAADGTRLWSALGNEPVGLVEAAGGYGYVPTSAEAFPQGTRVIDLATGAVLRTVRGEMPQFIVRD
jgi:hypothetical protein